MKILVTGATGKVGSRLVRRLARRGDHLRALVRKPVPIDGVEIVVGDLLDPGSLAAAVTGVDAIVHCAAFFRGATDEQAHATNDLGTQHLARAAAAANVKRFVFTSTGNVYGGTNGALVNEDAECHPTAAYPVSKLAAEKFLLALPDLDVRVLRLPFVYGDGDPHIAEIVPYMKTFPPEMRMTVAHHADIGQAVERILDKAQPTYRIYNVTADEAPTLAQMFASVGAPPPDGSTAGRAQAFRTLMDGTRIRADLGFKPEFPTLASAVT
ncbi:MAG: NAD(P)-dependent oxidoreductase [Kofleriaceae bacterium]